MIYILTFIVISTLHFFAWRIKPLRPAVLLISFLILLTISSLRGISVGIDTQNYAGFFERMAQTGLTIQDASFMNLFVPAGFELGFTYLTYLITLITSDFAMYLFITSLLIYIPVYLFIKRYSTDYYLSVVIYYCLFFFGSMSLIRQSIAMSILLLGTKYIVGRNPIKYLGIVLLATSFHVSALVGLILYPVYNKTLTRFNAGVSLLIAGFVFVAMSVLIGLAATINYRYEFYLDRIDSFSVASFVSLGLYLFILIILVVLRNKNQDQYKTGIKQGFLIITAFAAMIVMGLSIKVNSLDRLALVFLMYAVISIPIFISTSKSIIAQRYIKALVICVFVSYAAIILAVRPEWYGVTKYNVSNTTLPSKTYAASSALRGASNVINFKILTGPMQESGSIK